MEEVQLKDVKKGEFIRRKPDAKTTYIRGNYVRYEGWNRYSLLEWFGSKEIFLKGSTKVWVGFTF